MADQPLHIRCLKLVFCSLLIFALEMAAPAPPCYAQGVVVDNIQITGLVNLEQSVVLDALSIKVGQEITGTVLSELNRNSQYLYETGYFQEPPELTLDYHEGLTILLIRVLENPPFKGVEFDGNTLYTSEELMQYITQVPGEVTNLRQLEEDISMGILGRYAEDGYIGAYIVEFALSTLEEDAGTVYITIAEGIVEDIVFEGNEKTKESLLRMVVSRRIKAGEVLKKDDAEKAMQDLYNLGIFEQVEPAMDPAPTGGNIILRFSLVEAATGQAGVGLGYSTVNGVQGTLSYNERNFRGEGKTISAIIVFSKNNPGYQLDYSDPYISDKSFFSASLYDLNYRQQRNPDSPIESEIDVDSVGGSLTWGRRITDELSGNVSVGLTDYDYKIIKGDPFREYGPERRRRLEQTGQTRSVTFGLTHDARDNVFTTHNGTYLGTSVQIAGFGGDFDFRKYVADGRMFIPHAEKNTVALRAKVGLAEGNVPVFEEFRVGGVNSVRGLPEDNLTGTKMMLLNGEYRFPLDKKKTFTGVVFADAAWVGESFSETDSSYSAGIGIRFRVPALGLGSIRLDMGWDLRDGGARLHFGIGEMF